MRPSIMAASGLAAALAVVLVAGCGGSGGKSSTSTAAATTTPATTAAATRAATTSTAAGAGSTASAATDPCSLLTDAEVAKLVPGVRHGKTQTIAGIRMCEWPDSHDLPAVQLQVTKAPSTSLHDELANLNAGNAGYTIVAVHGLGDEAAAAFQKADQSKGLQAGLATLSARSGGTVVSLSTPLVQVSQGSQRFTIVEQLAATALSRLSPG